MKFSFTLEELATISAYEPEKGRESASMKIAESLFHEDDEAVAALLRSALAKLCICTDKEFKSIDFPEAVTAFE